MISHIKLDQPVFSHKQADHSRTPPQSISALAAKDQASRQPFVNKLNLNSSSAIISPIHTESALSHYSPTIISNNPLKLATIISN